MTPKKSVILYEGHPKGEIKANVVGAFMRSGRHLYVVRPGYDAQGRRRQNWTQIVMDGVPVWEWKRLAPVGDVLDHFDRLWKQHIGSDTTLMRRALKMTKTFRTRIYRDGLAGEEPAPALTSKGGRGEGLRRAS